MLTPKDQTDKKLEELLEHGTDGFPLREVQQKANDTIRDTREQIRTMHESDPREARSVLSHLLIADIMKDPELVDNGYVEVNGPTCYFTQSLHENFYVLQKLAQSTKLQGDIIAVAPLDTPSEESLASKAVGSAVQFPSYSPSYSPCLMLGDALIITPDGNDLALPPTTRVVLDLSYSSTTLRRAVPIDLKN